MSELTANTLRALAREARRLSTQVVIGTVRLGPSYWPWPGAPEPQCWPCAIGTLARRLGLDYHYILSAIGIEYEKVFAESIGRDDGTYPDSEDFAFPLLSLADELDAASEQPAAQPPSSAIPDKEKGP